MSLPPEQWSKIRDAMDRHAASSSGGTKGSFMARVNEAMDAGMSPDELEAYIAKLRAENGPRG